MGRHLRVGGIVAERGEEEWTVAWPGRIARAGDRATATSAPTSTACRIAVIRVGRTGHSRRHRPLRRSRARASGRVGDPDRAGPRRPRRERHVERLSAERGGQARARCGSEQGARRTSSTSRRERRLGPGGRRRTGRRSPRRRRSASSRQRPAGAGAGREREGHPWGGDRGQRSSCDAVARTANGEGHGRTAVGLGLNGDAIGMDGTKIVACQRGARRSTLRPRELVRAQAGRRKT